MGQRMEANFPKESKRNSRRGKSGGYILARKVKGEKTGAKSGEYISPRKVKGGENGGKERRIFLPRKVKGGENGGKERRMYSSKKSKRRRLCAKHKVGGHFQGRIHAERTSGDIFKGEISGATLGGHLEGRNIRSEIWGTFRGDIYSERQLGGKYFFKRPPPRKNYGALFGAEKKTV